nr:uncharacterized protein LOC117845072 isoform X2 [Setaria viridis]
MQFYSKQRSSPKLSHACCSGVCAPLCEGASCARATTGWVAAAAGSSTQMQAGGRQTGKMEMSVIKDMVIGKLAPLVSTSRLSYCSILNLMNRVEGQFTSEHVTRNSFHQFQYEKGVISFKVKNFANHWLKTLRCLSCCRYSARAIRRKHLSRLSSSAPQPDIEGMIQERLIQARRAREALQPRRSQRQRQESLLQEPKLRSVREALRCPRLLTSFIFYATKTPRECSPPIVTIMVVLCCICNLLFMYVPW